VLSQTNVSSPAVGVFGGGAGTIRWQSAKAELGGAVTPNRARTESLMHKDAVLLILVLLFRARTSAKTPLRRCIYSPPAFSSLRPVGQFCLPHQWELFARTHPKCGDNGTQPFPR